jgi:hypothetical protein
MPHIAIVWDFDGTLTPLDSTTKTVEILQGSEGSVEFWPYIKSLRGDTKLPKWEHVLAMDAPIWMYALSRLAARKKVPLNSEFFEHFVLPHIFTYPEVENFLCSIKALEKSPAFKNAGLDIHHFIITAGLKDLVELVFPKNLIRWTFGCRYTVVAHPQHQDEPESVPVFCMDETVKTRSLFEISKGAFCNEKIKVNTRIPNDKYWAPFSNMIYIGDGDTDVPALSLVRSKGGMGIAVYNPSKSPKEIQERFHHMRLDKRADLITPANFSQDSELFKFIETRCVQIRQRYEAETTLL